MYNQLTMAMAIGDDFDLCMTASCAMGALQGGHQTFFKETSVPLS